MNNKFHKKYGYRGCSITILHKVNAIIYLDDVDYKARLVGTVNTIRNEGGVLK
ncbi:hypothetical protein HGQ85_02375 [Clostridioides difficile]|nr:hypothetical protein [Clostridioides difficile]